MAMISNYYGGPVRRTRALILSEVPGVNLLEQERPGIDWEGMEKVVCGELARCGVVTGDFNFDSVHAPRTDMVRLLWPTTKSRCSGAAA